MEFKGTKGKWRYEYDNSDYNPTEWYFISSEKGDVLRRSYYDLGTSIEEIQYNALLISKAPEMLEMLKRCERTLREVYELETTEIKQLIKQATEL